MKQVLYALIITFGILSCNQTKNQVADSPSVPASDSAEYKLHKLTRLSVTGDFDGDKTIDTIFQHTYSSLTKSEIEYAPDPFQIEWEEVVNWFFTQNADVYLTIKKIGQDTLHLGPAQGLYCLINIGDNNHDGKDEVALVIEHLDFSRLNSCKIYSLCNSRWIQLMKFGVSEGSFDFEASEDPVFEVIRGSLEQEHGKWFYNDILKDEDSGKMLPLKVEGCS